MRTTQNERLPRLTKLLYGAGDLGFSLTDTVIGVLFAIFLTDVVGLRPSLAAAAMFVGRSWDYVNDPLIGYLSDRTRTRWGRRRPFLLFGFAPFALAFTALWWRPPIATDVGLAVYYGIAYLFYDATATLVYMPYYALTPELTENYDERTALTSYRMAFSILGGLIAFTLPLAIIGTMRPENSDRVLYVGAGVAILSALPLLLTFLGTRERAELQRQRQPALRDSLRAALRNRPFLFAVGLFLFTWSAIEIIQGMLLFFLKYRMNLEAESELVAGAVFVAALLTLPVWEWASRRWDKRTAYIVGMVFLSAVMITLIVISPNWGLGVVFSLAALAGVGVGAVHVLPWSMIPDAVEWDELQTGQRHEGMFYSLVLLLRKVASSFTLPLMLLVLDWSGYISNAPVQSPSAIRAIRLLMGPVPSVLLCIGIIFALVYPLGRERHAQVRAALASRRAGVAPGPD
ncbi:MAG: MFS transporter [Anaerolineae bacterium]|nr:MFS transporter [Anaerolineae bacterium]